MWRVLVRRGECVGSWWGKPEGRRPLGRPRRRWVDNIRMDLQEVGCGYMDWIGLAQDRERWRTLVSAVMNLRVPWNAGNFLTSCKPVSCSRRTLHRGVSKWVSIVKPTRCTNVSNIFYFGMALYMFRTVFPSIIRSSRLYIQQQAFVKEILLSACFMYNIKNKNNMPVAVCTILKSWWRTERPSETCRGPFQNKITLIH